MEIIQEWNENTGISWWKKSRMKLNKVIRKFNHWVKNDSADKLKTVKLLTKIEKHLEMKYCNQDGGSGYKDELLKMKTQIESELIKNITSKN